MYNLHCIMYTVRYNCYEYQTHEALIVFIREDFIVQEKDKDKRFFVTKFQIILCCSDLLFLLKFLHLEVNILRG